MGFPCVSAGAELASNVRDLGSIPELGRSPGEGKGYPLQYSCLVESHGQRSWAGYSSWEGKELDTTVWLTFTFHFQQWAEIFRSRYKVKESNLRASLVAEW